MATYEYRCNDCDTVIIVSRSISENDPGYSCEICKQPLSKVYSMSQPVFRGSGFYRTDK